MIIEGGATNKSFLLDLLDQPEVIDASADTGWIDRVRARGPPGLHQALRHRAGRRRDRGVRGRGARRAAAAAVHRARRPPAGPARERPADRPQAARRELPGDAWRRSGAHRFRVGIGESTSAPWTPSSTGSTSTPAGSCQRPALPPRHRHARADPPGRGGRRHAPGQPRRGRRAALPRARAGRRDPARRSGAEVEAGAPVLVLESMKMETVLRAPFKAKAARMPGLRRQPGGDRRAAAAPGADRRRRRRPRRRAPRPSTWSCRPSRRPVRRGPGRARHRRPAQPAARLRPRPARRAPGAGRLPGRRGPSSATARSTRRSSCCRCSPTCPS